jgi:hypothetical protein
MGLPRRPSPTLLVLGVLACAGVDRLQHGSRARDLRAAGLASAPALATPRPKPYAGDTLTVLAARYR